MFMLLQLLIVCLIVAILAVRSSTDQTGDAKDKSEGGLGTSHDNAEDSLAVGRCDVGHEVAWDVCELISAVVDKFEILHCCLALCKLTFLTQDDEENDCEKD